MSLLTLLNLPCTIERRTAATEDDYGNDVSTIVEVETVCELQQRTRTEPGGLAETSATDWRVYLPAGTAVDTSDTILIGDVTYEVVGDPWQARNPRTQLQHHVECSVRKTGT